MYIYIYFWRRRKKITVLIINWEKKITVKDCFVLAAEKGLNFPPWFFDIVYGPSFIPQIFVKKSRNFFRYLPDNFFGIPPIKYVKNDTFWSKSDIYI